MLNKIEKGQTGLITKVVKEAAPNGIKFLKNLPVSKTRYYRYFGSDAMDSYKKLGRISQFTEYGNKASAYNYPMFTKGHPGLDALPETGWFAVSKPKSILQWKSVNGNAETPVVNGQYNMAPVSEFDFYRKVPGKGFVKLNEDLSMPNGLEVSDMPHIDYLKTLDTPGQLDFLKRSGFNYPEEWISTLEHNPTHLQNVLWNRKTPKITLNGITY